MAASTAGRQLLHTPPRTCRSAPYGLHGPRVPRVHTRAFRCYATTPTGDASASSSLSSVEDVSIINDRAVKAFQSGDLAFGFSAGGLLFPYYIGVMQALEQLRIIGPDTRIAGASAGSLIAGCSRSGLGMDLVADACLQLADDCRRGGTRFRLRSVLEAVLRELLPQDAAERCSGRAYLAVTRILPRFTPQLLASYHDRDDIIGALLTSCHIPIYMDGNLTIPFRKGAYFDGGITNFLPIVPGAQHTVRVCCLPSRQLTALRDVHISPDTFDPDWQLGLQQMLSWALEPADEDRLRWLMERGQRDAREWAQASGVAAAAAAAQAEGLGALERQQAPGGGVILAGTVGLQAPQAPVESAQ